MRTSRLLLLAMVIVTPTGAAEQAARVATILHDLAGEHRPAGRGVDPSMGAQGAWDDIADIVQEFAEDDAARVLPGGGAGMLRVSPDGRYIAATMKPDASTPINTENLTIWDAQEEAIVQKLSFNQKIRNMAFAVPSSLIVLTSGDLHLFDVSRAGLRLTKTVDLIHQIDRAMWSPSITLSPNNRFLALESVEHADTVQLQCNAFVWDLHNVHKKPKKIKEVCRGSFSADGHYFASTTYYWHAVRLWYRNMFGRFSPKNIVLDSGATIDSFLFSPSGDHLAALSKPAGQTREIKIWNVHGFNDEPTRLVCNARKIQFSPNGQHLVATLAKENVLSVWNMLNLQQEPLIFPLDESCKHSFPLQTLIVLDRYPVVRNEEKIMIHDMQYPQMKPYCIEGRFNDMAFVLNARGQCLVTASDENIKVWDWNTITKDMHVRNFQADDEEKDEDE